MNNPTSNHLDLALVHLDLTEIQALNRHPRQDNNGAITLNINIEQDIDLQILPISTSGTYVSGDIADQPYTSKNLVAMGELSLQTFTYSFDQRSGNYRLVTPEQPYNHRSLKRDPIPYFLLHPSTPVVYKTGENFTSTAWRASRITATTLTAILSRKTQITPAGGHSIQIIPRNQFTPPEPTPKITQDRIWELVEEVLHSIKFSHPN